MVEIILKKTFKILILMQLLFTFASADEFASLLDDPTYPYNLNLTGYYGRMTFSVPYELKDRVNFWINIYTRYYAWQSVLHDTKYPDIAYIVVDNRDSKQNKSAVKNHYNKILLSLHKNKYPNTIEERRIYNLFANVFEKNKFLNASKRLRYQDGMRNSFYKGLVRSGKYLEMMEKVFIANKIPVELTRIAFVESMFNTNAYSTAQAVGIWQFMEATGQQFMTINSLVDERKDPFISTVGAAKLLKANFKTLKNWELAVTAYNHGASGLKKACDKYYTKSLSHLINNYKGNTFGFASKNFYSSFLAALIVERNANFYFGKVNRLAPEKYEILEIKDKIFLSSILKKTGQHLNNIKNLNPALKRTVLSSAKPIPKGYRLRLPHGTKSVEVASNFGNEVELKTFNLQ
ncbi:MAG: transglycosylase SLT domain-containing protein [Pseudomonadota bacterium]